MIGTLLELDVPRMTTLSRKWGNVPRMLKDYINIEDSTIESFYRQYAGHAVQQCRIMIDGGLRLDFPDNPLSAFYSLRPRKTPTGTIIRVLASIHVPTQTLCRLLAEALQAEDDHVKLRFYNALSYHAGRSRPSPRAGSTRQVAGFIFESWFHSFFAAKRKIDCHWVVQGSGDDVGPPTLSMPAHANLIPATETAPGSAMPPYYWLPFKTNFAGIDSALVLEDGIFAFQMILSLEHRSPNNGLRDLRKALPHDLKDLPWRVVFVGPEEGPVESVAKCWNGKLSFPEKKDSVPVGWSAVDPAQRGVIYKVCKFVHTSSVS